jgi:hypothetical protein
MAMPRDLGADPLARAVVSGFVASTAMQLSFGLACGAAVLLTSAHAAGPWIEAFSRSDLVNLSQPALYEAVGLYLIAGLLWAVVYTHTFQRWFSGPPWAAGLLFACVPWLFSVLVILPLGGGGLLGLAFGAGPLPLLASLVLHAVYGVTLTYMCGPIGPAPRGEHELRVWRSTEVGTAVGVLVGLVLGGGLGLLLVLAGTSPSAGEVTRMGMHPLAFLAGTSIGGGALGALVGSFAGLARAESI